MFVLDTVVVCRRLEFKDYKNDMYMQTSHAGQETKKNKQVVLWNSSHDII